MGVKIPNIINNLNEFTLFSQRDWPAQIVLKYAHCAVTTLERYDHKVIIDRLDGVGTQ